LTLLTEREMTYFNFGADRPNVASSSMRFQCW
jgi:hypothetical protein